MLSLKNRIIIILFIDLFLFNYCSAAEYSIILNNLQIVKSEYLHLTKNSIIISLAEGKVEIPLFLVRNIKSENSENSKDKINLFWYFKTGDNSFLNERRRLNNFHCQLEIVKMLAEELDEECYSFLGNDKDVVRAEIMFQTGMLDEFLEYINKLNAEGKNEKLLHLKGLVYFERGEYNLAYESWKEAYLLTSKIIYRLLTRQAFWLNNNKQHFKIESLIKVKLFYPKDIEESRLRKIKSVVIDSQKELGNFFAFLPNREIIIFIMPSEVFNYLTGAPKWAKGLTQDFIYISQDANISNLIKHELTHALINQLSFKNAPIWFQEGLAQYLSNDRHLLQFKNKGSSFEERERLLEGMAAYDDNNKLKLYKESLEKISALLNSYNELAIRHYLSLLRKGEDEGTAFKKAFSLRQ